jgi:hypothetical protein
MSLELWLRTLVPFVAAMFIRGDDFAARYEERGIVKAASGLISPDSTNHARLIEFQRLLAPVMGARWAVLRHEGPEPFLLNDLGLMPTRDPVSNIDGFAIPISSCSVLGIFPLEKRTVAQYRNGNWVPVIEYDIFPADEIANFNKAIALAAQEWIAGSEHSVISRSVSYLHAPRQDTRLLMERWPFDHETLVAHDEEWHRLVSATIDNPPPADLPDLRHFSVAALIRGYCPAFINTLNMYRMPTGLTLSGNSIRLSLAPLENYGDYFIREEAEPYGTS